MEFPITVFPLGGLGKIGMNCMLIGNRDRWVMVDCGILFPPNTMIGAERIIPDLSLVDRFRDRIEAVVITHGHEDHIGALPWVLPRLDPAVPVFASRFTTELIKHRLTEHQCWKPQRMRDYSPGPRFQAGPFEVEAIRVTHSIPDCASLVLRCDDGTVVHTGDWKIDEEPMDGEHFDRVGFERVGKDGVSLLLSDSTNINSPGRTLGERTVTTNIRAQIARWPGRVIVTQFASNLHRLQGLGEIARETGRRLVLSGRSLERYIEAAEAVGRRILDPSILAPREALADLAPSKTLVVTTGSQGEANAALAKASRGAHDTLILGRGDLVLHSARVIPGNEAEVYNMFNELALRGAEIVHGSKTGIHASGHAQQEELAEMMGLLRPGHFVPVHGEYTFLQAHAQLGRKLRVPGVTILQNGEIFGVRAGSNPRDVVDTERLAWEIPTPLYNDGLATGDAESMRLHERKKIAWNGLVVVDLAIARDGDKVTARARVEARAMWLDDEDSLVAVMTRAAERTVGNLPARTPIRDLQSAVEMAVRKAARLATGKRPEVIVVAYEASAEVVAAEPAVRASSGDTSAQGGRGARRGGQRRGAR